MGQKPVCGTEPGIWDRTQVVGQDPGYETESGIWDRIQDVGQDPGSGTETGVWDRAQQQENISTRWGLWITSRKPRLTLLALSSQESLRRACTGLLAAISRCRSY